ncbi:DUF1801 domain-containing protein [Pseudoteredinibacter isoporae]|uniref:YdhG-like domain-containing protein n=1 Tax=Pseudoteredinibacter isoporae TaxID=570281 RepID=A0A7X0MW06_9GAMM|nr:DUF1801 domain-containing protein [Pseudoteredinibacter isoporae]MBB6520399.1 hypothetical protein [Pseudoteredinibacter isoporae]NHO85967.1 DUF1801 domain-containing protein [Pseudoteredinibacter isoporae]NIB25581.1 DUF1801 domain-containing protein [Pseudoteredinibacter isoporae]
MSELKTKAGQISLAEFMAEVPEKKLEDTKRLIKMMKSITGDKAVVWGSAIVGFGAYEYKNTGAGGRWFKTGFSPRKQNFSIYIMNGFSKYGALLKKLGKHKLGKSCLYISSLKAVDEEILKELITLSYQSMSEKYD